MLLNSKINCEVLYSHEAQDWLPDLLLQDIEENAAQYLGLDVTDIQDLAISITTYVPAVIDLTNALSVMKTDTNMYQVVMQTGSSLTQMSIKYIGQTDLIEIFKSIKTTIGNLN
jgi:hypothetical protein